MDNRNNHNLILAGFYLLAVVLFGTFGFIEGNATEDEILIKANIKTAGGELIMNPTPDTKLIPNSKLFVLATKDQLKQMIELLKG